MPITSSSTDAQVQAAIDDNAGYDDVGGGVDMAKAYRTAVRVMVGRLSRRIEISDANGSKKAQLDGLKENIAQVEAWLNANDTDAQCNSGPLPIGFDLSGFRG